MSLIDDIKNIIRLAVAIGDMIAVIAMVIIYFRYKDGIMSGDTFALSEAIILILLIAINSVTFGISGQSPRPPLR